MAGRGGGGDAGGQGAGRRGLRLASPDQDGGLDSGLGTCSPTSEDRGLASSLGVGEGVDWLEAVVERLQTVFVVRGERERRGGGGRRRSRRKASQGRGEERRKDECNSAGENRQTLNNGGESIQRKAQHVPTGDKDSTSAEITERGKTAKSRDFRSQGGARSVSRARGSLEQRRGSFVTNKSGELTPQAGKADENSRQSSQRRQGNKITKFQDRLLASSVGQRGKRGSLQEERVTSQKGPLRRVLSEKSSQRGRRRKNEGGAETRPQDQGSNFAGKESKRGKACECHEAGREDGQGVSGQEREWGSRGELGRIQKFRSVSRAGGEPGRRGRENVREGRRKGGWSHFSSSSGEESEKYQEVRVGVDGGISGIEREGRRRSNEAAFEDENLLSPGDAQVARCPGEAYIRTRRDSTSPMWWDERFQGGASMSVGRRSRRGSVVNAVLMRRKSISYNRAEESEADLSRRYSYFLDFIDDLCSGATCSDAGRAGGASEESESQCWEGRRSRQPSAQSQKRSSSTSWGAIKHRLVLSSEFLNLGRECSGHSETVAMQCRSNYPVIGPKEFLLLHSSRPQTTHKESPDLWYRFLQL